MWPGLVVIPAPVGDDLPSFEQILEPADTQAFFAQLAVKALHICVLRGLAGLDVDQIDLPLQCPGEEMAAGQLGAIAPREAASWNEKYADLPWSGLSFLIHMPG